MSPRAQIATVIVASVLAVLAAMWVPKLIERRRLHLADNLALERMVGYCSSVRDAFEADAADFQSSDAQRTAAARERFLGRLALHAWTDLGLCAPVPPDIDKKSCSSATDYPCLAVLASSAAGAIGDARDLLSAKSRTLQRLQNHCRAVQLEVDFAGTSLLDDKVLTRDEWLEFFANGYALGSVPEIEMCAPEPPDLHLEECRRAKDYACVARVAIAVEQAIYIPTN